MKITTVMIRCDICGEALTEPNEKPDILYDLEGTEIAADFMQAIKDENRRFSFIAFKPGKGTSSVNGIDARPLRTKKYALDAPRLS